jgi:hypothetical protein
MTTRKTKPNFPSMIELPTELLKLATVTVEQKALDRATQICQPTEAPAGRSLPHRGKITLH